MKLPWVSREAYDERDRQIAWMVIEIKRLRDRIDFLTHPVADVPSPAVPIPTQIEKALGIREPDPVARVIREQAFLDGRTDYDLAAHLRNYASQLKREGLSPDEIVGKLVAWQSTETEPAYDKVG